MPDVVVSGELAWDSDVGGPPLIGKSGIFPVLAPITVVIAEAHAILRERLSRFLVQQQDMQVVGDATDGPQVLRRVEALRPDILLLDLRLPNLGGLAVLPSIRAKSPRTRILLLADWFEEAFIARALQVGVHGCVLETALPTALVKAIRTTHAGELWAPRKLLTQVVESLRQRMEAWEGSVSEIWGPLTAREQEVITWAVQGLTNQEIATQLGISAKTVKTHLQHVFRKLNVRRRVHLPRVRLTPLPPAAVSPSGALRQESRA
jgi:DNA-binding NarL/FixJ family response regulator